MPNEVWYILAMLFIIWILGMAFLIWEMKHAPFGWQDKNGWHEGKQNNIEIHKT